MSVAIFMLVAVWAAIAFVLLLMIMADDERVDALDGLACLLWPLVFGSAFAKEAGHSFGRIMDRWRSKRRRVQQRKHTNRHSPETF